MRIDFKSIKLNFDVFTIAYSEGGIYVGLLKPTIKSQYTRVNLMDPPLERSDRMKYERFCRVNNVLKRIVTQYEYNPSKGISGGGLLFKPKAMPDRYLICALRTVFGSSGDDEFGRIKEAACVMRGIINEKTKEKWGNFVGRKEAELKNTNNKTFQQSFAKYVDLTFSDSEVFSNNFTNDREISQLPRDSLYCRSGGMRVVVPFDEWHDVMKSV